MFLFVCLLGTALVSHHGNGVNGARSDAPRQAGIALINKVLCTLGCRALYKVCTRAADGWLSFDHPEYTYKYTTVLDVTGKSSAVLRIRGEADACVLLSDAAGSLAHEIIIGGWGNGRIVIRDRPQGDELAAADDVWPVLRSDDYTDFWVTFSSDTIAFGSVCAPCDVLRVARL
jgi:hypothetical protein